MGAVPLLLRRVFADGVASSHRPAPLAALCLNDSCVSDLSAGNVRLRGAAGPAWVDCSAYSEAALFVNQVLSRLAQRDLRGSHFVFALAVELPRATREERRRFGVLSLAELAAAAAAAAPRSDDPLEAVRGALLALTARDGAAPLAESLARLTAPGGQVTTRHLAAAPPGSSSERCTLLCTTWSAAL